MHTCIPALLGSEMGTIQEWTVEKPWVEARCALAEGPFYEKQTDALRFIDIKKKQLLYVHNVSSASASESVAKRDVEVIQLDVAPSVTADIEGIDPRERIVLGVKYGVALFDRNTGHYTMLINFHDDPDQPDERIRANDGAADPQGRFLLGSMTDFGLGPFQPEGALFRFSKDGTKEQILGQLTIPNGIGWSPDLKTMYFTHSPTREIFQFDCDPQTGDVTNQRLFYKHDGPGEPDGNRVDVEGNVWQAFYGENMVLKINPQGQVVGRINLPAKNITCVQFVGEDLIVTSAAAEGDKYGGSLFRVNVGVRGVDLFNVKL